MVFLKDINYKDIKTLKTEFFFQISITYVENGIQGACLDEVIMVDPGEEKWTRGEEKRCTIWIQLLEIEPQRLTKGLSIEGESF